MLIKNARLAAALALVLFPSRQPRPRQPRPRPPASHIASATRVVTYTITGGV